jgi:4-methylaminobutanoate oxidase (formaldehyde-forming)
VSNPALPYMRHRPIRIADQSVLAQRVTYVGELGWELYVANSGALAVWDALWDAGRPHGLRAVGYKAIDSLRLEKGYRYWSVDMTPSDDPYSAGLGFCVRLEKGDFLGREALQRIKADGPPRSLRTVTIDSGGSVIYGGEAVYSDGRLVGRLRSGGYGYTVGSYIGYVYLPPELATLDTPLEVESFGQQVPAVVAPDVLYDPKGARIRA